MNRFPALDSPASRIDIPVLAWAVWAGDDPTLSSGGALSAARPLPMSLRRRVTPIGRLALEAAWTLCAGLEGEPPRIVLSSRHGEYARTRGLLHSLAEGEGVSPAEFSLAVHHGLAGLLSIATGNRAGHNAVAAGGDTLGAALTEAAACLMTGDRRVVLMHFDEALPPDYSAVGGGAEPAMAFALLLGAGGVPFHLDAEAASPPVAPPDPDHLIRLLRGESAAVGLGGERRRWSLCRAA